MGNNIYIVGMPGSGKSTVTNFLKSLNLKNLDIFSLDSIIDEEYGIESLFDLSPLEFRKKEYEVLKSVSYTLNSSGIFNGLVDTGGGIVTHKDSFDFLKNQIVIFIDTPFETIKNRISKDDTNRPVLNDKSIDELYEERHSLYNEIANYTIQKSTTIDVVKEILKIYRSLNDSYFVINGPNLNMLGLRNNGLYGDSTLEILNLELEMISHKKLYFFQSNSESEIVDLIHSSLLYQGLVINPGAFTHTSIAIADALEVLDNVKVEVHLSNIKNREEFRKINHIENLVDKSFVGKGINSYKDAIDYINNLK